jgi:hypothetical protein
MLWAEKPIFEVVGIGDKNSRPFKLLVIDLYLLRFRRVQIEKALQDKIVIQNQLRNG